MDSKRRGRQPGSKNYPPEFRERIVAEANDPKRSIAEVAREYGLNANMVAQWRRHAAQVSEGPASAFRWQTSPFSGLLPVDIVDAADDKEANSAAVSKPAEGPAQRVLPSGPVPCCCEIDIEVNGRQVRIRGVSEALAERLLRECLR